MESVREMGDVVDDVRVKEMEDGRDGVSAGSDFGGSMSSVSERKTPESRSRGTGSCSLALASLWCSGFDEASVLRAVGCWLDAEKARVLASSAIVSTLGSEYMRPSSFERVCMPFSI